MEQDTIEATIGETDVILVASALARNDPSWLI
jgi:hypothetical protein